MSFLVWNARNFNIKKHHAAAREVELRALSRAVTERSTTMSIDPSSDSTTMSQMQREMSSAF